VDAGDDSLTGTDQRGFPRNSGGHVDIGAYQLQTTGYSPPVVTSATGTVSNNPSTGLCSVDLSFTVNPEGLKTTAFIQYGVTTNYGAATTTVPVGYGNSGVATNILWTGLRAGLTYHYCAAATSDAGTTCGPDQVLTTPAFGLIATTLAATSITATQATLNGSVNPCGLPTLAWFEWGATTNYGNFTAESTLGSGSNALPVNNALTGLAPCATYHYRIDAFNDLDTALGDDQSFSTPDAPRTITGCCLTTAGQFRFQFVGAPGATYTVLGSTNVSLPLSNWTQAGTATNIAPGQYQFTDPAAMTSQPKRFYRLRWQ
jgi:hypothetical protein